MRAGFEPRILLGGQSTSLKAFDLILNKKWKYNITNWNSSWNNYFLQYFFSSERTIKEFNYPFFFMVPKIEIHYRTIVVDKHFQTIPEAYDCSPGVNPISVSAFPSEYYFTPSPHLSLLLFLLQWRKKRRVNFLSLSLSFLNDQWISAFHLRVQSLFSKRPLRPPLVQLQFIFLERLFPRFASAARQRSTGTSQDDEKRRSVYTATAAGII